MTDESTPKKRLTLAEIVDGITDIAQTGEGADRFRALKLLSSMEQATVVIPPPLEDWEVVDRVVRILRGAGPQLTQAAYARAFPNTAKAKFHKPTKNRLEATPEQKHEASKVTSLKILNRKFPECKMSGMPKGYPQRGSIAAKVRWCQEAALGILVERDREKEEAAHNAMKAAEIAGRRDTEVPPVSNAKVQEPAL